MQKLYFLPLSQVADWSKTETGSLSYHLGKLVDVKVKVAPGFVVPKETLLQIARDNHLAFTVQQWLTQQIHPQPAKRSKKTQTLSEIFTQVEIAPHISQQYLDTFYRTIPEKKVSVVASWLNREYEHLWEMSDPVQGDANVFQTLLQTWAKTIEATLDPDILVTDEELVPAAFLIQSYLKADLTGSVHTLNSQKSIYQITAILPKKIHSEQGEATFLVDVRTWQIVKAILPPGLTTAKLEKHFKPEQVLHLAQLAYRIKLHDLHQLQISWEIVDHEIYVSNVERLADWEDLKNQSSSPAHKLLLIGSSVITGENTAPVTVMTGKLPDKKSFDQQILVIAKLEHLSLNNTIGLKGVITEQPLAWQAHQLLQQYHIPVVARVPLACKKLKTGQSVTLNGYTGRIYAGPDVSLDQSTTENHYQLSSYRVMGVTNQAWDHQEFPRLPAQGIIYQPAARWLEAGIHPLELLRAGHQQTLKNHILSDLTSYRDTKGPVVYQLPSLRSDQLLKLAQGKYFESKEANPALGFTGTTRLLHQSEWLDFELEVLTQAQAMLPTQLRVLLPPTRNPEDFSSLTTKLKTVIPSQVWLPLNYPANILELNHYLLADCEYVVVQTEQLLALSHGLDPEYSDLLALYSLNVSLLKTLLATVLAQVKPQQVLLEVNTSFQVLSEVAVELGLAGVVTSLNDATTAHHLLSVAHHQVVQEV